MDSDDNRKTRFEQTMAHIEAILKWVDIPKADHSLVVDTGELESKLLEYKKEVDALLAIAPTPENRDELATQVAHVWATAGAVRMVCEDVDGPLDRLIAALCDEDDDEDEKGVNDVQDDS